MPLDRIVLWLLKGLRTLVLVWVGLLSFALLLGMTGLREAPGPSEFSDLRQRLEMRVSVSDAQIETRSESGQPIRFDNFLVSVYLIPIFLVRWICGFGAYRRISPAAILSGLFMLALVSALVGGPLAQHSPGFGPSGPLSSMTIYASVFGALLAIPVLIAIAPGGNHTAAAGGDYLAPEHPGRHRPLASAPLRPAIRRACDPHRPSHRLRVERVAARRPRRPQRGCHLVGLRLARRARRQPVCPGGPGRGRGVVHRHAGPGPSAQLSDRHAGACRRRITDRFGDRRLGCGPAVSVLGIADRSAGGAGRPFRTLGSGPIKGIPLWFGS